MKSFSPSQIISSFITGNYDNLYQVGSTGKSGSLFFYTTDKKYMVKTLPQREFDSFRSVLRNYFTHLDANKNSMISRFFGLFRIQHKETDYYLVVMPNVFKDVKVGLIFDLKGSTAKRNSLKSDQKPKDLPGIPLKDNDFTNHVGNLKFYENDKT